MPRNIAAPASAISASNNAYSMVSWPVSSPRKLFTPPPFMPDRGKKIEQGFRGELTNIAALPPRILHFAGCSLTAAGIRGCRSVVQPRVRDGPNRVDALTGADEQRGRGQRHEG